MEKEADKFLKPLEFIEKVETPPFLLTRIQQKIQNELSNRVPPKTAWVWGISLAMIILLNVLAITKHQKANNDDRSLIDTFQLMSDNNLYR